jgi:creatinine amidohydrolase
MTRSTECEWIRTGEYDLEKLRRASKSVAALPLASIESHGPHLPLGSDTLCLENIVKRITARETVAVLPVLAYSNVCQTRARHGAVHIRSDVLMDLVENICDEVHRNGFDKILLLHGHGGNTVLHDMFLTRVFERQKPYVVYSLPPRCAATDESRALLQSPCGHACEMETSMNMVAAPDQVNLKRLGKKTFSPQPAPDVGAAIIPGRWALQYPQAAIGQPQLATPEKGEKIMAAWADEVVDVLRKIKRDTITPAYIKRYAIQTNTLRQRKRRQKQ